MTGRVRLRAVLLLALCSTSVRAGDAPPPEALDRGREYTAWFHEGRHEELFARMSPALRDALGSAGALAGIREQLVEMAGDGELVVLDERVEETGGLEVYLRTSRWERGAVLVTQFAMDAGGTIAGFFVRPSPSAAATTPHGVYRTKTKLRLPFEGEWLVVWGGRRIDQNYHAATVDQRFATDLQKVRDGSSHAGTGAANADYYAFGQAVLAPGSGTVVGRRDGLPDNLPGAMDPAHPLGNHVILDHHNGEFSFLAHLERGSLAVERGDEVRAGQRIGRCGNSGNSSEPHLHYHLQNSATFRKGEGLPASFERYRADGEEVERGEPVRGQRVAPR